MLVDVLTDNRNRTGSDVRNIFSKLGGAMAEPGAVGWQFSRRGVLHVNGSDEDTVMMAALDAGADDVADDGEGSWRITCEPSLVFDVRDAFRRTAWRSSFGREHHGLEHDGGGHRRRRGRARSCA